MSNKLLRVKYKEFIGFLKNSNFKYKKEGNSILYKKSNLIVKISDEEIIIFDLEENRKYNLTPERTCLFLIGFVTFLITEYQLV